MSGKDLGDEVLRALTEAPGSHAWHLAHAGAGWTTPSLSDLASALLDAREALRSACDWLEAEVDLQVENGTTGGHADDYERLAALRACLPDPRADEVGGKADA